MKLLKMNSILILLMIFVSYINTSKSYNSNKSEIEQLMEINENTSKEDTELNKFYEKEKNKYNEENEIEGKSNKSEEIKLLELSQKLQKKTPIKSKAKKPIKKKSTKSTKPKKVYPPAKIISQKNPYFPKNKSDMAYSIGASYCKYKKGFLYLVKNPNNLGIAPLSIKTVPVYVNLTMRSLNVQMGLSYKTLFETIKVTNILKITKKFKNAYCFEIIEDTIIEKTLAKSPIVLCASNSQSLMKWVKALQEFKDCIYNTGSRNDGSRTLMDFNRINKLIKPEVIKKPKAFDPMFYNNGPPLKKKEPEYVMKRQLEKIVGLLERGQMNNQSIKRKMKEKLKKAKKIEYDIRLKKDMINKIMDKRNLKEKENEYRIRSNIHKKREVQLLKAVKSRINQYKKKEGEKLNKMAKNRLIEIKNRANDEAKGLMKSILNQAKLTPYGECINPKLKGFTDKSYIKSHCFILYGENKVNQCTQKKEFCSMCCNFHIGVKFSNKRNDCKKKCTKIINYTNPKLKNKKSNKKSNEKSLSKKSKGKKTKKNNKGKARENNKGKNKKSKAKPDKKIKEIKEIKEKEIKKKKNQIQIKEDLIKRQKQKLIRLKMELMDKKFKKK